MTRLLIFIAGGGPGESGASQSPCAIERTRAVQKHRSGIGRFCTREK
jgi:hypothetical protein